MAAQHYTTTVVFGKETGLFILLLSFIVLNSFFRIRFNIVDAMKLNPLTAKFTHSFFSNSTDKVSAFFIRSLSFSNFIFDILHIKMMGFFAHVYKSCFS